MTDLYPNSWPQGWIFVRITNNGPDTLSGVNNNRLDCSVTSDLVGGLPPSTETGFSWIAFSLAPGETQAFATGIPVDGTLYYYDITCTLQPNVDDPNPSNNSYREGFPG
ncbi:MAG TPA: hypothetical protein VFI11_07525 [Anaerolineales bacterium]|nr:hypothetical protein [Anaerolineales bacterium]